jgi:hypothetical protein
MKYIGLGRSSSLCYFQNVLQKSWNGPSHCFEAPSEGKKAVQPGVSKFLDLPTQYHNIADRIMTHEKNFSVRFIFLVEFLH